ncbi:hypothetical protein IW262DRAFT_1299068 [Armillaria fumosa]|nr:hypothetical protein IW262DRAFT_1299068 [Armillaria fumosa]
MLPRNDGIDLWNAEDTFGAELEELIGIIFYRDRRHRGAFNASSGTARSSKPIQSIYGTVNRANDHRPHSQSGRTYEGLPLFMMVMSIGNPQQYCWAYSAESFLVVGMAVVNTMEQPRSNDSLGTSFRSVHRSQSDGDCDALRISMHAVLWARTLQNPHRHFILLRISLQKRPIMCKPCRRSGLASCGDMLKKTTRMLHKLGAESPTSIARGDRLKAQKLPSIVASIDLGEGRTNWRATLKHVQNDYSNLRLVWEIFRILQAAAVHIPQRGRMPSWDDLASLLLLLGISQGKDPRKAPFRPFFLHPVQSSRCGALLASLRLRGRRRYHSELNAGVQ